SLGRLSRAALQKLPFDPDGTSSVPAVCSSPDLFSSPCIAVERPCSTCLRLGAVIVGLACVGLWRLRKIDPHSEPAGVLGWVQVAMGQRRWSCKTCPQSL